MAFFTLALLLGGATAFKIFDSRNAPPNLSKTCQTALQQDLNCSPIVRDLRGDTYYQQSTLERTCKPACSQALNDYSKKVVVACGTEKWSGYDAPELVSVIPALLQYNYELVCLMDTGRYCNLVAGGSAAASDTEGTHLLRLIVERYVANSVPAALSPRMGNLQFVMAARADPCDMCFVKKLRIEAGSPYYDGWKLAKESVYESKTASCKVTGMPLVMSTIPGDKSSPTTAPEHTETAVTTKCNGKPYEVKGSDTCRSIAAAQGISTGWLLVDNQITSCAEIPKSGSLCLSNTCKTYVVKKGDNCEAIAQANGLTSVQLQRWNPVSPQCYQAVEDCSLTVTTEHWLPL
jgi:LysM repeat protein